MKISASDVRAGRSIEPADLLTYLRTAAWRSVTEYGRSGIPSAAVFEKEGTELDLYVPLRAEAPDFASLVAEVVNTVARVERRAPHELLADLRVSRQDVVRVRSADEYGTAVPIGYGATLFAAARDLITSAALGTTGPRAVYHGRRPKPVTDFMQDVLLGQTEPGSFVLRVMVPLPMTIGSTQPSLPNVNVDPPRPFGRRVTELLARALVHAKEAATIAMTRDNLDAFTTQVENGVSAELCRALALMRDERSTSIVDIEVSWGISLPRRPTPRVEFTRDTLEVLGIASRFLAEQSVRQGFELVGYVERLGAEIVERREGDVTIVGLVDEAVHKVKVTLPHADYSVAIRAHDDEKPVSVVGDLRKHGQLYRLEHPTGFSIMRDDDGASEDPAYEVDDDDAYDDGNDGDDGSSDEG